MRSGKFTLLGLVLACALGATAPASAHRLDELLQAARIGIAEDRVDLELDLTPGLAVADAIVSEIDWDRDGVFSSPEQRAFVDRVFAQLSLRTGDHSLSLTPASFTFPTAEALREGNGVISIRAASPLPDQDAGAHQLTFDNRYRPDRSVYLANALVPETDRVAITAQHRDSGQTLLTIAYRFEPRPHAALPYAGFTGAIAVVAALARKSLLK